MECYDESKCPRAVGLMCRDVISVMNPFPIEQVPFYNNLGKRFFDPQAVSLILHYINACLSGKLSFL